MKHALVVSCSSSHAYLDRYPCICLKRLDVPFANSEFIKPPSHRQLFRNFTLLVVSHGGSTYKLGKKLIYEIHFHKPGP